MKEIVIALLLALAGCTYVSYTTKLEQPIDRIAVSKRYISSIMAKEGTYSIASIGDELFVMKRFVVGQNEFIAVRAPTSVDFPKSAVWQGTYRYNDGVSGDLTVYTTPSYYAGTIGVILDSKEELATGAPLVQVAGAKMGRRWKLNGSGRFFVSSSSNFDNWALRYGGKNSQGHVFEIVNKAESTTSDVLQSVVVSDADFERGVSIRNVLVEGKETDVAGVIRFKATDMLKD